MNRPADPSRSSGFALLSVSAVLVVVGLVVEDLRLFPQLTFALQRQADVMPSTLLAPVQEIEKKHPLLSLFVDQGDLNDKEFGLLVHPLKKGLDWEKRAFVSYFDDGVLQFASEAGIRVHGGKSRVHSPTQSYRLFFNSRYGSDHFGPNRLFHDKAQPLRRLVVHNDLRQDTRGTWWHLVNPLAYDLARRVGCLTPDTKAARVFLNGKWQGVYVLTEHLNDRSFLKAHFGHDHFTYGNPGPDSRLWRWLRSLPTLDVQTVDQVVDVDNVTRWAISVLFCATTDPFQGVMLKDDTNPDSRWFFVNWDMDHSFMDHYQQAPADAAWQHDTFHTILRQRDVRSEIVTRLLTDDPKYREMFKRRLVDALNHELTPDFLSERFDHYAVIGREYGVESTSYQADLAQFLKFRAAHLRALARESAMTGESFPVRITGAGASSLIVDGYPVGRSYEGWYFDKMPVTVRVGDGPRISSWRVNGAVIQPAGSTLEVMVDRPTTIEAIIDPTT